MVTNTLTSDTWHPSPQNSKHGIYSHLAPDRGSGGSWKPLPVLPGTPPLKTQPLGCPNALFQGFPLAPRSPHAAPPPPRIFMSHPERRFRCRLFVLSIFQVPSPTNTTQVPGARLLTALHLSANPNAPSQDPPPHPQF